MHMYLYLTALCFLKAVEMDEYRYSISDRVDEIKNTHFEVILDSQRNTKFCFKGSKPLLLNLVWTKHLAAHLVDQQGEALVRKSSAL